MAGHQEASDGEAKLSASFARMYVASAELPTGQSTCYNCGVAVSPQPEELQGKKPLCGVCWTTLQVSIKRAAKQGFRIG